MVNVATAHAAVLERKNRLLNALSAGVSSLRAAPNTTEAKKPLTTGGLRPVEIEMGGKKLTYSGGKLSITARLKPDVQDSLEENLRRLASNRDDLISSATSDHDRAVSEAKATYEAQIEAITKRRDDAVAQAHSVYEAEASTALHQVQ